LQKDLQTNSKPATKAAVEKYMRYVQKYRGMKNSEVRTLIFKDLWALKIKNMDAEDQKEIAHQLLAVEFGEDKFVGMLIFEKIKKNIELSDIKRIEELFKAGRLVGWANTDGICGTIFRHWAVGNKDNIKYISEWKNCECLWLQRASCVTFVTLAKHGDNEPNYEGFLATLNEICLKTIQNSERFVQLGTGWLLRNIGTANQKQLFDFIHSNIQYFSREGLSYAVEKLKPNDRKRMMNLKTNFSSLKLEEEVEKEVQEAVHKKKKIKK